MKKKSVGLLELEMAVLERFLEKTPLNPLGVKLASFWYTCNFELAKITDVSTSFNQSKKLKA
jgi:hypothetical protein